MDLYGFNLETNQKPFAKSRHNIEFDKACGLDNDFAISVNALQGAEDELKDAVGIVRPVSIAFEVIKAFRFYESGVFTSDSCGTTPMVSPSF